jgi:hypothetical protein
LVSSISIADREGEPEGIGEDYLLRGQRFGAPIWHSGAGKKDQLRIVRGENRELARETRRGLQPISKTADVIGAWRAIP